MCSQPLFETLPSGTADIALCVDRK